MDFRNRTLLYCSYMPFIKNGGLFVPTSKKYRIGDEVFMLLSFSFDDDDNLALAGEISWVSDGTQDRPTGVVFDKGTRIREEKSAEKIPAAGKVVWITPPNARDGRAEGVGVQFNENDGGAIKRLIERHPLSANMSETPTPLGISVGRWR